MHESKYLLKEEILIQLKFEKKKFAMIPSKIYNSAFAIFLAYILF